MPPRICSLAFILFIASQTVLPAWDLYPGLMPTEAGTFTRAGSKLFYVGSSQNQSYPSGRELAVTDNPGQGSVEYISTIQPGPGSPEIAELTPLGERVFFSATDPVKGRELWTSDGTEEGTRIAVELSVAPYAGSFPRALTVLNDRLLFWARADDRRMALWSTDGTESGTWMLAESVSDDPASPDFAPGSLIAEGDHIYFALSTRDRGRELWKTNGSKSGTVLVKDIRPGPADSTVTLLAASGQGQVYFQANDGYSGSELWKTDGTTTGTLMVRDLASGADSFKIEKVAMQAGQLFFAGSSPAHDRAVWRTDGSAEGTVLLHDFDPAGTGPEISSLAPMTGRILVTFSSPAWQGRLWSLDPVTGAGTQLLNFTQAGETRLISPVEVTASGSLAYFKYTHGTRQEIWKYNGQTPPEVAFSPGEGMKISLGGILDERLLYASNHEIQMLNPTISVGPSLQLKPYNDTPLNLRIFDGDVYYSGDRAGYGEGTELFASPSLYGPVSDLEPGPGSSNPEPLIKFNDRVYFLAETTATGRELWKTNGTEAGTQLVKDLRPGADSSEISGLVSFNGRLFFSARGPDGDVELWCSDGTEAGTVQYADLNAAGSSRPAQLIVMNGALYFTADDGSHTAALWRTQGSASDITRVGTAEQIRELTLRPPVTGAVLPSSSLLYFAGTPSLGGEEGLYRTDGTSAGTLKIPHSGSVVPAQIHALTLIDERLAFLAGAAGDVRLWTTDGIKSSRSVLSIRVDHDSRLVRAGPNLYFHGISLTKTGTPTGKPGIWRTTKTGTSAVQVYADDMTLPGRPRLLKAYEDTLFFAVPLPFRDESTLWRTQGNPLTTLPVDYVTLPGNGDRFDPVRIEDSLCFEGAFDPSGSPINSVELAGELQVIKPASDGSQTLIETSHVEDIGVQAVGRSLTRTYRLQNTGYAALPAMSLEIWSVSGPVGHDISVSPSSLGSLPAGASVEIKVTIAPTAAGLIEGRLYFIDPVLQSAYIPSIQFWGRGWTPISRSVEVRTPPLSVLALENTSVKLTADVLLPTPATWSWTNGEKEVGKAQDLVYSSVKASHAGFHALKMDSLFADREFLPVPLVVVSRAPSQMIVRPGQPLTVNCRVSSPPEIPLTYQWFRNGLPLADIDRVQGSRSDTLQITESQEDDSADYACVVSFIDENPNLPFEVPRTLTMNHGTTRVIITDKPEILFTSLPDLFVGEGVDLQLPATYTPTKYIAKGLPAGLVLNAATGRITGRPTAAKGIDKKTGQLLPYSVTFTVVNLAATSLPVTLTWWVKPVLSAGVYDGLIARSTSGIQTGLGARVKVTTTATGTLSGQLTLEGKAYRFTKILDTASEPALATWIDIPRGKGIPSLQLELQPGADGVTAYLHDGALRQTGALYPAAYSKTVQASDYDGPYTSVLNRLTAADDIPAGSGFLSATVTLAGDVRWTGRLADGSAITGAGFLSRGVSPGFLLPVHMPLYKNTGSLHGWMILGAPAAAGVDAAFPWTSGTLSWLKRAALPTSKDRTYKSGIPLHDLGITGSLYVPPAKTDILFAAPAGADNFDITLTDAGLTGSVSKPFTLAALGKLTLPPVADRPPLKSLALNVANGTFTGQVSFSDPNPTLPKKPYVRTVACQGVLLKGQKYGAGYFLLPQLPVSTPVQTTLTTSPILSGDVLIETIGSTD